MSNRRPALLLMALSIVAAGAPLAAGQPDEDGFEPIFNGESFDGWVVMGNPEGFTIEEGGILRSDAGSGGNWLRYEEELGDFVLRLEWRVGQEGNSGVFIRAAEEGNPWETGHEIQISNQHRDDLHCTGSLYGTVAVDPRPDETAGVWHTFEIRCRGPHITVIADDVTVIDVDQREVDAIRDKPTSGYIGLQDSHNPSGTIEYRNIRLRRLDQ